MTALTIAAVVLAAGWVFARSWLRTRYMVLKETGHPQYFTAGVMAVCLFTAGACIHHFTRVTFSGYSIIERHFVSLIPQLDQPAIPPAEPSGSRLPQISSLIDGAECAGWALLLALSIPWLFNRPVRANSILLTAILKKGGAYDAIDRIYALSLECSLPLAFTLRSGKVYIGLPWAGTTVADLERKWAEIFPLLSGHRDNESQLVTGTNYMGTYEDIRRQSPDNYIELIDQFKIVIPFSEVVSVQTFNIESHDEWFGGEEANAQSIEEATADSDSSHTPEDAGHTWNAYRDGALEFFPDETFCLTAYNGFVALCSLTVLFLAYDFRVSLVCLLFAGLFAAASCEKSPLPE